jgi:hypothetical protein
MSILKQRNTHPLHVVFQRVEWEPRVERLHVLDQFLRIQVSPAYLGADASTCKGTAVSEEYNTYNQTSNDGHIIKTYLRYVNRIIWAQKFRTVPEAVQWRYNGTRNYIFEYLKKTEAVVLNRIQKVPTKVHNTKNNWVCGLEFLETISTNTMTPSIEL